MSIGENEKIILDGFEKMIAHLSFPGWELTRKANNEVEKKEVITIQMTVPSKKGICGTRCIANFYFKPA